MATDAIAIITPAVCNGRNGVHHITHPDTTLASPLCRRNERGSKDARESHDDVMLSHVRQRSIIAPAFATHVRSTNTSVLASSRPFCSNASSNVSYVHRRETGSTEEFSSTSSR